MNWKNKIFFVIFLCSVSCVGVYASNCAGGVAKETCACPKCSWKDCPEFMSEGYCYQCIGSPCPHSPCSEDKCPQHGDGRSVCVNCVTTMASCQRTGFLGFPNPCGGCNNCCTHQAGEDRVCTHDNCNAPQVGWQTGLCGNCTDLICPESGCYDSHCPVCDPCEH